MTWVLFDESDRRRPAPYFDLPGILGGRVGLGDTHGQENLMVFFAHNPEGAHEGGCPDCRTALIELAGRLPDIRETNTQVLGIVPGPTDQLKKEGLLENLPFPVVVDPDSKTRRAYAGLMADDFTLHNEVMLFLLDEFGAAYVAYVAREADMPAISSDTLKWLEYIAMQCPE